MAPSFRYCRKILIFCSLFCCVIVNGCRKSPASPQDDQGQAKAALCAAQFPTIGFYNLNGSEGEYLEPCVRDVNGVTFSDHSSRVLKVYEYDGMESPDHREIIRKETWALRVERMDYSPGVIFVKTNAILYGPMWSPDSKFFFYVTEESHDNGRSFRYCFDDAYDLHVFSVQTGTQSRAAWTCAGLPYFAFRWLYP